MIRLLFLTCFFCTTLFSNSFMTYQFSGGRFGDCLISYLHAKWLAYQYDMPLLYKPFPYSSSLVLHREELRFHPFYLMRYRMLTLKPDRPIPSENWCIYSCPYFPVHAKEEWYDSLYSFDADWKDKEFKKIAREMISPIEPLELLNPPKTHVNIAIHVREGGGFDLDTAFWDYPLKMPPLDFYIKGLLEVLDYFPDQPIYCYLFTDSRHPAKLAKVIESALPPDVSWEIDYRRQGNHHAANVLEDFFSFFQFDVFIHPHSNFSLVPALIGDFAITYSPSSFLRKDQQILITKTNLEKDEEVYQAVLERVKNYR